MGTADSLPQPGRPELLGQPVGRLCKQLFLEAQGENADLEANAP